MSLSQDIESRVNILDIVNRYVQTKKAWTNYKALCPFHQEKTASFVISPQKNIAYCFSCHKWGGPIRFLMEIEKLEFGEAVQILAKDAGIELKTDIHKERDKNAVDVYALYKFATEWYHDALYKEENKHALDYLLGRWMHHETIKKFQLGYSSSPRDLLFFLREKWFEEQAIINAWLFVSPTRDKFFGRVIFPIANNHGNIVAFTGRVLDSAIQPKYLNSPASHIFDKSSILYWFHIAKWLLSKVGKIIIVEGQMDTIRLHQAGFEYAVWISGTALTKDHIRHIKRFTKHIYLCLDSDNAGIQATFLSMENLQNEEVDVRIISIPNGKDPDEFIASWWDFEECIQNALSPIDFYLKEGSRKFDVQSVTGKKELIHFCFAYLRTLSSRIEKDIHIREMARILDITPDILHTELRDFERRKPEKPKYSTPDESENTVWEKKKDFSYADILAIYIKKYHYFDLFFRLFQYTLDDLQNERSFSLLTSVLQHGVLDDDQEEYFRCIDLIIEEENISLSPDLIERKCSDLIQKLHVTLFQKECREAISSLPSSSPEYLLVYSQLLQRAQKLRIDSTVLKSFIER